ncbi:DoxX family protein [Undibacterium fentianense]|uniref:DoxX family protein n=1 Tax=Undibacterium fentianense TaxID=2828728 RepID=A0A941IC44_9BURK|nr:DoxX family protein [Undibacterium fentianense]MBR7799804.1 DoxX family protein [Undibacterium fentianense]
MTTTLQNAGALVGRLLLAGLFLPAGFAKLNGFEGTVGYIASVGLPAATLAAAAALALEIVGGLALIFGLGTRWAAIALAFFTLLASFIFHAYWAVPADQAYVTQLLFFKNIAVAGGLMVLAAFGGGQWSIDARRVS